MTPARQLGAPLLLERERRQVQTTHAHREARACLMSTTSRSAGAKREESWQQQNKKPFIAASRERPIGVYRATGRSLQRYQCREQYRDGGPGVLQLRVGGDHIPPGQLARSLARLRRKPEGAAQPGQ
jgi:hypothetical protein